MRVIVDLDADEVVDSLLESLNGFDEAFELIKRIDLGMEDFGFTERLAKHFIAELLKESGSEPFDINQLLPERK